MEEEQKYDEFGIPIKAEQPKQEVDEFGIPIKKKRFSDRIRGILGARIYINISAESTQL